ncbi:hypothetical protein CS006_03135 [Bifidobacterium primatium]|uniref:Uncharacterized protein n=1 Tax=Bifidobacterium primatium TaxID=2045438 RepID=A0A2M9HBF2_9BIFI|nr:immunoglobulin-like domain-containing protein [Bifidobacterium primatium]PJM74144.1 hypothetical protein CS006_03135 [Bifidobacterium primatium]
MGIWKKAIGLTVGAATLAAGMLVPMTASAADATAQPLIHYSFDKALAGKTIANEGSAGDANATLSGDAAVADGRISLTGSQTISVPTTALKDQKNVTVSIWLKNNYGNGNTAAAYIGAAKTGNYPNNGYFLLNPANPSGYVKSVMTTATAATPNGSPWGTEVGPGATNAATSGTKATADLALYTTVINGADGTMSFYLNGKPVGDATYAIPEGGLANYGDLVAYIGRSAYSDPNTKIDVDDYAVYGTALSADAVADLYNTEALEKAVSSIASSVPTSADADFTLPTAAAGATIAWRSDNAAIAVDNTTGKAAVTRPAAAAGDAKVTLTATFTLGGDTRTAAYTVNVPKQLSDADKAQKDAAAIAIESSDDVRSNISLPVTGENGSKITWTVADGGDSAAIGDVTDGRYVTVNVKRPAAGTKAVSVTLKASVVNGTATETKNFTVEIQPMPASEEKDEAYVWAFFTGEGAGAEKISLAASKGNDALDWNTLNGGTPLFTSEYGEKGLRDPFIIRSKDGDRFYMLATDLKIDGRSGGFDSGQRNGSKYIEVWKSDDLVNWSKQSHVKVSSDYAGNTWAPEAYYDTAIGKYVVYWASNMYDTTDNSLSVRTHVTYNQMIYVTTDDFVSFSDPQVWVNVNQGQGKGMIDATIAEENGVYYRFYKDESQMKIREEQSTNLLATIGSATTPGTLPKQTGLAASAQWTLVRDQIGNGQNNQYGGTFSGGEGPSVFPANEGDVNGNKWYLFIDQPGYHGGPNHYIGFKVNNLATGDVTSVKYKSLPTNSDGGKPRHGTVVPVTRAQYQKVLEAYAKNVAVKSVDAMAVSTKVGEDPTGTLPAKAHLTHVDGSEADVDVVWEKISADDYAKTGTFTVKGVAQDDSRMPVEATVTVAGTSIADADVTLEKTEYTADGSEKKPGVTVKLGDKTLVAGADYKVAYANNVKPGTGATVTVAGIGLYEGTKTVTFTIKEAASVGPTPGQNGGGSNSGSEAGNAGANGSGSGSGNATQTGGKTDGSSANAAGSAGSQAGGKQLSKTGVAVGGVAFAVALLAAAGAAAVLRRRRA